MLRSLLASASAFGMLLLGATAAQADPASLSVAIASGDTEALAALAQTHAPANEVRLAHGALAALHRDDDAAMTDLRAAAADATLTPELRRRAFIALSGIYMRQSRFAEATDAAAAAEAQAPDPDPKAETDAMQSLEFSRALVSVAPMRVDVSAGETPIHRDIARLARADVSINGQTQESVLDTGAGYSTIVESAAQRLGLRMLDAHVTVKSSASDAVPARLGVADTLSFAGGTFHDVVFIVLPDDALSFANGLYRIDAIVGLPVLMQFGRLEFLKAGEGEVLRHERSPHARGADSNLTLDALQPIALVRAQGADHPLRMLIDTGARNTSLSRSATDAFPALATDAVAQATTVGGAGGTRTHADALSIPHITFDVEGVSVTLNDIHVLNDGEHRHGTIGQDLLRSGGGYVIDFDAMRFEVLR